MANAKKCDRCGMLYELSNADDVPSYNGMKIRELTIGSASFKINFDLCPSCAKAAWSFLFYKKEDKKDDRNISRPSVTGDEKNKNSYGEDCEESRKD